MPAPDAELLDELGRIFVWLAVEALVQDAREDFADAEAENVVPSHDDKDAAPAIR